MKIGFIKFGTISKKKRIYWELQLFAMIREFSDGFTLIDFKVNFDRYKSEHTPAFQIEFTFCNVYNHFQINQYNSDYDEYQN